METKSNPYSNLSYVLNVWQAKRWSRCTKTTHTSFCWWPRFISCPIFLNTIHSMNCSTGYPYWVHLVQKSPLAELHVHIINPAAKCKFSRKFLFFFSLWKCSGILFFFCNPMDLSIHWSLLLFQISLRFHNVGFEIKYSTAKSFCILIHFVFIVTDEFCTIKKIERRK